MRPEFGRGHLRDFRPSPNRTSVPNDPGRGRHLSPVSQNVLFCPTHMAKPSRASAPDRPVFWRWAKVTRRKSKASYASNGQARTFAERMETISLDPPKNIFFPAGQNRTFLDISCDGIGAFLNASDSLPMVLVTSPAAVHYCTEQGANLACF